jgi:hypothetical protein
MQPRSQSRSTGLPNVHRERHTHSAPVPGPTRPQEPLQGAHQTTHTHTHTHTHTRRTHTPLQDCQGHHVMHGEQGVAAGEGGGADAVRQVGGHACAVEGLLSVRLQRAAGGGRQDRPWRVHGTVHRPLLPKGGPCSHAAICSHNARRANGARTNPTPSQAYSTATCTCR